MVSVCNYSSIPVGVNEKSSSSSSSSCIPTSGTFDEEYEVLDILGRGRFAKVCSVRHRSTKQTFAAKMIRRWRAGKDTIADLQRELDVLEEGKSSPFISTMHHYYLCEKDVVILMEQAYGGDLHEFMNYSSHNLSLDQTREIIRRVLLGLNFLHGLKIVHLDVKPENILLRRPFPDCEVVLCDFGLARKLDENIPFRGLFGTPDFASPEVLNYNPIHLATDLWSVGAVTYFVLTGVSPFWAATKEETFINVTQLRLSFPDDLFNNVPSDVIAFIQRLLVKNPRDRPSADRCLEDVWLTMKPLDSADILIVPDPQSSTITESVPSVSDESSDKS